MQPLDYPDRHLVSSAEGWLELGLDDDAELALAGLSPEAAGHPDVSEIRWRLLAARREWQKALEAAQNLTAMAPERAAGWIHQSFSLHELKRTQEAWEALLPAAARFPKDPVIPYNLACYACQMGRLPEAKEWLRRAAARQNKDAFRAAALSDPDLAALRDFISGMVRTGSGAGRSSMRESAGLP